MSNITFIHRDGTERTIEFDMYALDPMLDANDYLVIFRWDEKAIKIYHLGGPFTDWQPTRPTAWQPIFTR